PTRVGATVPDSPAGSWLLVGGAGFIGGHLVDRLLAAPEVSAVRVFDNFSSGRRRHLASHEADPRLTVERETVRHLQALRQAMTGHDTIAHLPSNPHIATPLPQPPIYF